MALYHKNSERTEYTGGSDKEGRVTELKKVREREKESKRRWITWKGVIC